MNVIFHSSIGHKHNVKPLNFCITPKQKKLLLDCMVKSKSFLNSEPYLTKEFKTSQKKKCQNCVLSSSF